MRTRAAVLRIQSYMRMRLEQRNYQRKLVAITQIQAFARMIKPRKAYIILRDEHRRLRALERERMKEAGWWWGRVSVFCVLGCWATHPLVPGLRTVGDVSQLPVPSELTEIMEASKEHSPPYTADEVRRGKRGGGGLPCTISSPSSPSFAQMIVGLDEGLWKQVDYPTPAIASEVCCAGDSSCECVMRLLTPPLGKTILKVAGHDFSKYVSGFFQQGSSWAFVKGALEQTLLKPVGFDQRDMLEVFNAIQHFLGDPLITSENEAVYGNYIVQRGILNEAIRDELYCQLCNQTWLNPNEV